MTEREDDVMKRAVAEEFGVTHIEDPEELRLFVQSKVSEMNAVDRAAFEMRIGRILREDESGGPPSTRYAVLAYMTLALVAWFVWRPLAVVVAILACANIRGFVIRRAPFWSPSAAIAFGGTCGVLLSVLVGIGTLLATHTLGGRLLLAALGFLAAGYIGYGVPTEWHARTTGNERRILAQGAAVVCYLVAVGGLFFVKFLRS